MRQRDPKLPEKMTGGIRNPLGAMALYLGNTLYRIHGTNDVKSIGQAQSSGCFRMMNSAVVHLATLVEVGTPVTVVARLPQAPVVSRAEEARQQASRAEEARQQASRAEEARQQASRAEEAGQQASRAEEARQQASRAEEARQQASRAEEEARQQASRAEEARQQASRAEEARQQASRAEEARQQAALPPVPRPPADRGVSGAGAPASGRDYRALREYMMGR